MLNSGLRCNFGFEVSDPHSLMLSPHPCWCCEVMVTTCGHKGLYVDVWCVWAGFGVDLVCAWRLE